MNRLILNFICKNEAHVITRMLNSVKSITDAIVCTDTGSSDNTIELIKKFGEENNIKTIVHERAFDNFENSRNHALEMARQATAEFGWDKDKTWTYWIDCDEELIVDKTFDKKKMNLDIYMINALIGASKYTRNTFARTSKAFRWYGPVHEFIHADFPATSGVIEGLSVNVHTDGGSWKGNVADKYKRHAAVLEDYIDNKDRNARWVFYTAQSYHDSAIIPDNRVENEERLRRALKYYRERVSRTDGYEEERYYSQFRIGTIMRALEYPWSETMQELLKAYAMEPLRAEPIRVIVEYYLSVGEPHLAYMYSKFMKVNFHQKNPYPKRLLFVDEKLYQWLILELNAVSSFYSGKKEEAAMNYKEIQEIMRRNPEYFDQHEIAKINSNTQFFI